MGAVRPSRGALPGGANVDPNAARTESPLHEVQLSAFFIGKFEMTQGQWLRFGRGNPSYYRPETLARIDLRHPAEQMTWSDAAESLRRRDWMSGTWTGCHTPSGPGESPAMSGR